MCMSTPKAPKAPALPPAPMAPPEMTLSTPGGATSTRKKKAKGYASLSGDSGLNVGGEAGSSLSIPK